LVLPCDAQRERERENREREREREQRENRERERERERQNRDRTERERERERVCVCVCVCVCRHQCNTMNELKNVFSYAALTKEKEKKEKKCVQLCRSYQEKRPTICAKRDLQ